MSRSPLAIGIVLACLSVRCAWAEELPDDARRLVAQHEAKADEIRKQAEKEIDSRRAEVIRSLEALQTRYAKEGKLEQALAIRERIRNLKTPLFVPGTVVQVEWHQTWFAAEVVEAKSDSWYIRYAGYGPEWNEWVPRTRIRRLPEVAPMPAR